MISPLLNPATLKGLLSVLFGIKIETKSPVLITNNGQTQTVVLQENMPNPCSVVIVATGASNTNVKLEILRAVQAMFISNSCNIEVFAGN